MMKLYPEPTGDLSPVVTVEECMHQCRVELESEGAQLLAYAFAAQSFVEKDICTPLAPRGMTARASGWPALGRAGGWRVGVRRPISVDAIRYTDADGAEQLLPTGNYLLREELGIAHIVFRQTAELPPIDPDTDIAISLTAGWPLRQCPLHLKQTVLALTEHFNMKRSANLDDEARSFLDAMLGGSRLNVIA